MLQGVLYYGKRPSRKTQQTQLQLTPAHRIEDYFDRPYRQLKPPVVPKVSNIHYRAAFAEWCGCGSISPTPECLAPVCLQMIRLWSAQKITWKHLYVSHWAEGQPTRFQLETYTKTTYNQRTDRTGE
jgi:hypothetical protein